MALITIIVCTYNRSESLRRTLTSIYGQNDLDKITYEVIVVDNNSTDNTKDIVKEISLVYNNLNYCFEPNPGIAFARNRGIKEAAGDIIAFTDDDCIVDKNWLAIIKETFAISNPDCIGGKINPVWEGAKPAWLTRKLYGRLALLDYGSEPMELVSDDRSLYTANMALRTAVFRKYGAFQETIGRKADRLFSGEDTAYVERLIMNKAKVLYQPTMVVGHIIQKNRLRKNYFRKWHFDTGLSQIMIPETEEVKYIGFNIPRYHVRKFLSSFWGYIRSLVTFREDYFYYECRIIFYFSYFLAKIVRWGKRGYHE